jgi:hypothetical protein
MKYNNFFDLETSSIGPRRLGNCRKFLSFLHLVWHSFIFGHKSKVVRWTDDGRTLW